MSANIRHISDADFQTTVGNANKPVLVDFWAEWCGPCHAIAPVLEELADEYADKLSVVKVNVDENPDMARKLGVRSIPTLFVFKDGQAVANRSGAIGLSQLRQFVEQAI